MQITRQLHLGLSLFFLLFSYFAVAQNNSLKVYANFLYGYSGQTPQHYDHVSSGDSNEPFVYDHLSFAYRREKGLTAHEFELKLLFKSEGRDNHRVNQFQTQLGYELSGAFQQKLFKVLKVRLGTQVRVFYLQENIESLEYGPYPVENYSAGIWQGIFAHLEYDLNSRIYINANTCILSGSISLDGTYVDDPAKSEKQRKTGGFDFTVYNNEHILRVGVGFRLGYMGKEGEEDEIQKAWDEKQRKKGKKRK
jgi:hypothetical protein